MKLIFLGTPQFAVPTLEAVAAAGHEVAAVFTQPDRPRGRGHETGISPVKEAALRRGIPVHQPERLRGPEVAGLLAGFAADAMVVVGYGQIIPQAIIDLPRRGIINVHASLLPNYRGAAPIQWAIANGENRTGVTTMRIDAGLDTGDILLMEETEIGPEETALDLNPRLAAMGARLLVETLAGLEAGTIEPRQQDGSQATRAPMLKKEDGLIDWTRVAKTIADRARGFLPWPGAYTSFRGQMLQVWKARAAPERNLGEPGTLHPVKRRLLGACGGGTALELVELQLEGRKKMPADAFLNGQRVVHNERVGEKLS
jgi:methionyl-tRNA formyltransferase